AGVPEGVRSVLPVSRPRQRPALQAGSVLAEGGPHAVEKEVTGTLPLRLVLVHPGRGLDGFDQEPALAVRFDYVQDVLVVRRGGKPSGIQRLVRLGRVGDGERPVGPGRRGVADRLVRKDLLRLARSAGPRLLDHQGGGRVVPEAHPAGIGRAGGGQDDQGDPEGEAPEVAETGKHGKVPSDPVARPLAGGWTASITGTDRRAGLARWESPDRQNSFS